MCSKKHKLSYRTVPHSSCRDCIQRTHNPSLPWKLSSFIKLQTKVSARTVKLFFAAKKGISIENWHRRAPSGVESTQNGRCTLQVLASYKGIKTNHKYPLSRADFHNCVKNRRRPWTAVGLHKSYLGQNWRMCANISEPYFSLWLALLTAHLTKLLRAAVQIVGKRTPKVNSVINSTTDTMLLSNCRLLDSQPCLAPK